MSEPKQTDDTNKNSNAVVLCEAKEPYPVTNAGQVTNLRRLTMAQMKTQLEELGVACSEINQLARWERVALIRRRKYLS